MCTRVEITVVGQFEESSRSLLNLAYGWSPTRTETAEHQGAASINSCVMPCSSHPPRFSGRSVVSTPCSFRASAIDWATAIPRGFELVSIPTPVTKIVQPAGRYVTGCLPTAQPACSSATAISFARLAASCKPEVGKTDTDCCLSVPGNLAH